MFGPGSRYAGVPLAQWTTPDGRVITYVTARPIHTPLPGITHDVDERDRIDLLAWRYLDDPEQWWRLADANRAFRPDELAEVPGRRIVVPLPVQAPR